MTKTARMKRCGPFVTGIVLATLLLVPAIAWACPMCKDALLASGEGAKFSAAAHAYALSIVALLVPPLALLSGLSFWIVRSIRRTVRAGGVDTKVS